ncbi:S8 family serine peptidase [Aeribacillus sp. FSL K6-2848]|uniref:S8 family peptidase n=1 Tax=unclassified Aeribacillus TaxID=2640495 RepID=UPI0030F8CF46
MYYFSINGGDNICNIIKCLPIFLIISILLSCSNQSVNSNIENYSKEDDGTWGFRTVFSKNITKTKFKQNNVKVAVLDSGINKSHPALKGRIVESYNALNPNEDVIDDYGDLGHGTAIAGILVAKEIKDGITGISPTIKLYDVKVLNEEGKSDVETVVRGIEWCIKKEVDIINISFGFEVNHEELEQIIQKALNKGIIIVASSGNTLGLRVDYPAKYDGVISVTALKPNLQRSSISGKGKIEYAAPGINILTTDSKGGYSEFKGTSFATAFVSGTIATLISNTEEKITNKNLKTFLKPYVKDLGKKGFDEEYGYGLVQIK